MAKKHRGKKGNKKDEKPQDEEVPARLDLGDDGPTLAVSVGPERPWLDPDRPEGPGPQDTTDPRTAAAPPGADKPDQSLQDLVGKVGDTAIPTGPNKHGIGDPVPGEEKVDGKKGADWLKEHDEKSLLKEFDLNPDAGRPSSGFGSYNQGKVSKDTGGEDTVTSSKSFVGGASDKSEGDGSGMGNLDKLPAGVELNANAPHDDWYSADAKTNTKAEDLQALIGVGGAEKKEFKAATAESFKEKQGAASGGNVDAQHKAWMEKNKGKYTDPDYIESTPVKPENPQDVDPGAGISHTVNPLDDNPATIDTAGFDPKADPNAPYILTDPDAVDVPVAVDGSQPVPDPGAGISKTVNPLTDPTPPLPPGGTPGTGPGGGGSGGGSTPATVGAPSTPQAAVQSGEDFAAPDAGAPGAAPEPGAVQDLDGDGQPG